MENMMKSPFKLSLISLAILAPAVSAEEIPLYHGDEIVVTATRTARTADETLAASTVITRRDIERSQANSLMELLNQYAGLNVSRTGGAGKETAVYLRGTEDKHVLVLVDGVRAASATTGEYDWNALSPEQIERIEIVRGPLSSLYGSDAIGGVIQIFTRRDTRSGMSATVGSRGTRALNLFLGGGDDWRYSMEAGQESTNGLPTFSTDNTAYAFNRNHFGFGFDGNITPALSLGFRLAQSWGRNELDPATGDNDYVNRTASLKLGHRIDQHWTQTLVLGNSLDSYTSHSPFIPAGIATSRNSLSWQHDVYMDKGRFSVGVDYWNDHATKDNSGVFDKSIDNAGLFGQYQFTALGGDAQLGARRDKHEVFGGYNTWNIGWGRDLTPGFRLTASHGTAFKAPTINGLFWPFSSDSFTYAFGGNTYTDTYVTQGNSNLRPETSRSSELGLRYKQTTWDVGANLYETWIKDLIDWAPTITPGGIGDGGEILTTYSYQPANVSSSHIRGLELTGHTIGLGWNWFAAYTRLLAENLDTGKQLDRRPKGSLILAASRQFGAHRLRFEGNAYSERQDIQGTRQLAGYGLVNAIYEYVLNKSTALGVRIENVFDRDYALARTSTRFYDAPGRSLFVTVRYQPAK
jgi:vitamin B12 transporter